MKYFHSESGFSAIEGLLILVIVGIIGFSGYFVYHVRQATDRTLAAASKTANSSIQKASAARKSSAVSSSDASGSSVSSANSAGKQDYLVIKEWGVEIPLSSTIDSAVYSSGQYSTGTSAATGGSAKLGLLSLGSDCGSSAKAPLGEYVEFTQRDVNAEDTSQSTRTPTLHDLAKTAVEVPGSDGGYGGYYVAYAAPSASTCSADSATLSAAETTFQQALQGLKPASN